MLSNELEMLFKQQIRVSQAGKNKLAISTAMYKTDGTKYEIFLLSKGEKFYLSDGGATYAELDKIFEMGEPDVIKNLVVILKQYGCRKKKNSNAFVMECSPKDIHVKYGLFVQALSFMLNMKIFYR